MIIRSKAPLRLGLAGGGTDVPPYCEEFGGYTLNATIDMYAYCTIETTNDGKVSFYAVDKDDYFECCSTDYITLDESLTLHKGIYNRVIKQFNSGKPLSIKMTTYCDAPPGSGLGSSSTLVVAILKAYVELLNLPLGDYDLAHLAYEIERIDVGFIGGKQDQYAATFGGFNFIEFYSNDRVVVNPLRIKDWIINELENSMILYFTGVSRQSEKIIREQAENVRIKNESAIEAMHKLKKDALAIKEAILKGDILRFAEHFGHSWEAKKRMADKITNNDIDNIYEAALKAGAYSGKVSGAGGGGFMVFLVDPIKRINVIRALNQFDGRVLNFHFTNNGTQGWSLPYETSLCAVGE